MLNTSLLNASTSDRLPSEAGSTIGLLITNPADRRLLLDFLQHSGYNMRGGAPQQVQLDEWSDVSLIIADESAARQYQQALLALKHQAGGFFLPLLITLPQNAESSFWLKAGFDDVLRLPLRKVELAARVQVYLHLRAQSEEAKRLTRQIVRAQEAERQHLARELHDEIGQVLTAVNLNLQALQLSIPDPDITSRLKESLSLIEHTLNQVRDLSLDLHPSILDDLGLVPALQWYLDRQAQRANLVIELTADPPELNLPAEVKTTCFRITQEAMTNIIRHANAKQVRVQLHQRRGELELLIRDDGSGFQVDTARRRAALGASLGLVGMQERMALVGGRLGLKSEQGVGTEISARFPLRLAQVGDKEKRKKSRRNTK